MATNPMQRKIRNSFILGIFIALLIGAAVCAMMYMQIKKYKLEINSKKGGIIYMLNRDVESGQVLTMDMFTPVEVSVPNGTAVINATKDLSSLFTGTDIIAKVAIKANTFVTADMVVAKEESTTDDLRVQEYNVIVLPTDLEDGNYIDVRLMLPTGEDYIVVSKKMVSIPLVNGSYANDTITMNLTEEEILIMSSAIVENYEIEGSKLYATKYAEAGIQKAATTTYSPKDQVISLMKENPNLVQNAVLGILNKREVVRKGINNAASSYGDKDNITSGMDESIQTQLEKRQQYLQSLY